MKKPRVYACSGCGKLRTKEEGGTTFTMCDECWENQYKPEKTSRNKKEEVKKKPEKKDWVRLENGEWHHVVKDKDYYIDGAKYLPEKFLPSEDEIYNLIEKEYLKHDKVSFAKTLMSRFLVIDLAKAISKRIRG